MDSFSQNLLNAKTPVSPGILLIRSHKGKLPMRSISEMYKLCHELKGYSSIFLPEG